MPGSILNADTGFPQFKDGQSTSEKLDVVMNYLYMLLEQLRYSMGNLDEKNFNPSGLEQLQKTITEPIYVELFDEETGKVTRLFAVVDGLGTTVSDIEGNVSSLTQTVDGFTLTATTNQDGKSSMLSLTSGKVTIASTDINFDGMVTFTDLTNSPTGSTRIKGGWLQSQILQGNFIQGSTIQGAFVYGQHGVYGSRLISRNGTTSETGHNRFQDVTIDEGTVSFGIVDRLDYNDAFTNNSGSIGDEIPTPYNPTDTIHYGNKTNYGQVYADFDEGKFRVEAEEGIPLKLDSGSDMSIDAVVINKPAYDGTNVRKYNSTSHGIIFLGGKPTRLGEGLQAEDICPQVRIGGENGQVVIFAGQQRSGIQPGNQTGIYEFLTDGIYYNGTKIVSVPST